MKLPYQSASVDRDDLTGAAMDQNVDPAFFAALAPLAGAALKAAAPSLISAGANALRRLF